MNRSLIIVLGALALCAGLFTSSYFAGKSVCCVSSSTDELGWLQQEFRLSNAEMARVRKLHEGYLPKCAAMCKEIAAKKREVAAALDDATNAADVREPVGKKLGELALLRAQCQLQMLQHFVEVSRAMPPEQGQRYLAEMKRITLGAHEQVEESMSGAAGQSHGHE